jgi:hypothetical protein
VCYVWLLSVLHRILDGTVLASWVCMWFGSHLRGVGGNDGSCILDWLGRLMIDSLFF